MQSNEKVFFFYVRQVHKNIYTQFECYLNHDVQHSREKGASPDCLIF